MNTEEMEAALRQLSGKVTALEFAVKVLLGTHPHRERLAQAWQGWLAENIDRFMDQPSYDITAQRVELNRTLADLGAFTEIDLGDD